MIWVSEICRFYVFIILKQSKTMTISMKTLTKTGKTIILGNLKPTTRTMNDLNRINDLL